MKKITEIPSSSLPAEAQMPDDPSQLAEPTAVPEPAASKPGFFDVLAGMTSEEWERHVVYLYRLSPRIDTQSESAYIEKRTSAFDAEDVLQSHGSGRYMAILKDTSLRKKVTDYKFSVYHPNLPPKVDPAHVLRTPENDSFWQSWGRKADSPAAATPGAGQGNGMTTASPDEAAVAAIKEMAEVAKRAQDAPVRPIADPRLMELWENTAKDRDELAQRLADRQSGSTVDPMKLLDHVFTTAERLRGPAQQENPMQLVREVLSTVKAMQDAGPQGNAASPMASFKEFVETAQLMRETFGPQSPTTAENQQETAEKATQPTWIQALGAIAPAFAPLVQAFAAKLLSPPPLAPQALPQPQPPDTRPEPTTTAASPSPPSFIEQIAPLVLNALSIGADGARFADSVCVMYGPMAYQTICALGHDGILTAMKGYAPLWQRLASVEPQVAQFIAEFLSYGEQGDEQEQPAAAAAAPAA
ncbi:MAG: hypothetical protein JST93_35000 [Acidobacteria bacterium]|nr:hypothetical protein [Acidobacteriota bacterium]